MYEYVFISPVIQQIFQVYVIVSRYFNKQRVQKALELTFEMISELNFYDFLKIIDIICWSE